MNRRSFFRTCIPGLFLALGITSGIPSAWAQMDRPVTIVVPYAPGATSDLLGRLLSQQMGPLLKRTILVENKPGAGSTVGASQVAHAAPDGNTLLLATSTTLAINPWLYKKLPYDPAKDFTPIGLVASVPLVVIVHPSVKAQSIAELIALAKSSPEPLTYGSAGNGSPQHLAAAMFAAATGIELNHIPYKGSSPALTDLLGEQIKVMFIDIAPALQYIRSGKVRALAVTSSQRHATLPTVPTIAESKAPGTASFEAVAWQGLVAPAGTPAAMIEQYNKTLNAVLAQPDFRKRLESEGVEPNSSTVEHFGAFIKSETQRWSGIVKAANVTLD
ncbi:MAG: tripartite tricarboxylate transporter substrate binding protein [Zoogloeaceae bacterium]|jgi:tripartite-type tricarboxylate transporter receptor subunit TctC|nr:tripartite tricarboxylate transporter substrate binding protein [Zoogloeaceae bacterium]